MTQTILITGASTGLGRATAQLFSARGHRVIATMRDPAAGAELAAAGMTVLPLDVTDLGQIEAVRDRALELGGVDVLFNNAGYGIIGPIEGISDAEVRRQLDTNLLGTIRTTQAFAQHFRERGSGTIITTTSIGGHIALPLNSLYHATKWALEGFSESIAFEFARFGVRVKTVAPGGIKTDFLGRSMAIHPHPAYQEQLDRLMGVFGPERVATFATSEQIAEVVWEAATDGKDQLRYVCGDDAIAMYAQRKQVGDEAFRAGVAQMFFG